MPAPAQRDATLFAAVVRAIVAQAGGPVRVDPRPVRGDQRVTGAGQELFVSVTEGELRDRRASITVLGLPAADVESLPRCDGASKIHDAGGAHRGCPQTPESYALVASTGAAERSPQDSASVIALVLSRSPQGAVLTTYQVVAVRQSGGWRVARVTPVLVRE